MGSFCNMLSTFLALFSIYKQCVLALPCTLLNHTLWYEWNQKCTGFVLLLSSSISLWWDLEVEVDSGSQFSPVQALIRICCIGLLWYKERGKQLGVISLKMLPDHVDGLWFQFGDFTMGVLMFDPWCGFSVFCEKCFIICLQSCRFCFQLLVMGAQPWT